MPIPPSREGRYAYHFTHIDNLPNLLETGFLANNHKRFPKGGHRSIAARGIQERRSSMMVPCGPHGCVHDYVPLYFGAISPMLLSVVNAKNVNQCDILYFEFPISLVEGANAVFTDASANTAIPPNFYTDPADFDKLNWEAIDSRKWGNVDDEFRHQRMAELLIHRQLPIETASRCVVWNSRIRKKVEKIVASAEAAFPPVKFESPKRRHWFLNFPENKRSSIVLGPRSRGNCE